MAHVYADLIRKGTINPKTGKPYTIDDVPERIREQARKALLDNGYDVE